MTKEQLETNLAALKLLEAETGIKHESFKQQVQDAEKKLENIIIVYQRNIILIKIMVYLMKILNIYPKHILFYQIQKKDIYMILNFY